MEYGKFFSLYLMLNSKGLLVVIGVHKFKKTLHTSADCDGRLDEKSALRTHVIMFRRFLGFGLHKDINETTLNERTFKRPQKCNLPGI